MFSPDREPHPAVKEAKFLQQPAIFEPVLNKALGVDGVIPIPVTLDSKAVIHMRIINRYAFVDLSHLMWQWLLVCDSSPAAIHVGTFQLLDGGVSIFLDKAMRKVRELEECRSIAGNAYFLNIRGFLKEKTSWADAGHIMTTQQFPIAFKFLGGAIERKFSPRRSRASCSLFVKRTDESISVYQTGSEVSLLAIIDKSSGSLISYCPFGENILNGGIMPSFTRAATDNDNGGLDIALKWVFPGMAAIPFFSHFVDKDLFSHASRWNKAGLGQKDPPEITCITVRVGEFEDKTQVDVNAICNAVSLNRRALLFKVGIHYRFFADGRVRLSTHVVPQPALEDILSIPRIGLTFRLNPELYHVQYYGLGPDENYPDRKSGSEMGVYETSPAGMGYLKYVVPGENGSRSECQWVSFREDTGAGVCIASSANGGSFSCSALLHSASELDQATHTRDLPHRANGEDPIHVNIDHQIMGVGGDTSWYPVVYDEFLVKPTGDFTYAIVFLPMGPHENPANLAKGVDNELLAEV